MTYEDFQKDISDIILTEGGHCPVTSLIVMLQGKWKLQIIYALLIRQPLRFGELRRCKMLSGITNAMLASALHDLESAGFIKREQFNEIPPHVEYSLTAQGRELMPVFYAMAEWGLKHVP